ncbi:Asparagine synthetase [Candidatus Terasakiella magnetica]|nr:Asparagine synthetase [Candidatus Terasakiella magnetica]
MCGIVGSTGAGSPVLASMLERLGHRGPDGQGLWRDEVSGLGLAHARLAVIDLSPGGAQPMLSPCGRWAIAFNGEIYNHGALRVELEAAGECFASTSDTEVMLRLLMRHGLGALERLVGMFAFALWDREAGELLLARDRVGIKPLVWAPLADGGLAFASEVHALKAHPGLDLGLDPEALSDYLACLYVPAPRTIHRGIRKLPPGSWLRWKAGEAITAGTWWRPSYTGGRAPSVAEAVEELLPLLRDAVRGCLVSDVPVGCFLSGGIDSSVIAALMAEAAGEPIRTFTMTFDAAAYDERDAAQAVATHVGSRHTELPASPDAASRLESMVRLFGEPFGNPTALLIDDLSRLARQHVTVALVGDGGDEVFAGYPRYQGGLLAQRLHAVPAFLRQGLLAPLAWLIPERSDGRHLWRRAREFLAASGLPLADTYAAWVEYFSPAERRALLRLAADPASPIVARWNACSSPHPLDRMQETDLATFLPGNLLAYGDAMSMAHALELRLPLLDHRVIEAAGKFDAALRFSQGKKTLLKAVARRLLPADIVDRPKLGFNPPLGLWLKGPLKGMVAESLTQARVESLGLSWRAVAALLAEHDGGRRDHSLKVWSLLVLDAWDRQNR